jgi:Transcriptional regulator
MSSDEFGSDAPVKVIGKAGRILRVFLTDGPELQLQHLAERSELDMSTASRIANSLVSIGVLRYDPVQRLYSPGLALLELSQSVLSRFGFRELAHRELLALSSEHGWACYVGVLADDNPGEVMYIDAVATRPHTAMTAQLGDRRLATSTASGRVLLAMNRAARRDAERVIRFDEEMEETLAAIARQGFDEVFESEVVGLAFPVRGASGDAVATLGLGIEREGYEEQRDWVIATMRAKAKGVSTALELTDVDDVASQYRRASRTRVV